MCSLAPRRLAKWRTRETRTQRTPPSLNRCDVAPSASHNVAGLVALRLVSIDDEKDNGDVINMVNLCSMQQKFNPMWWSCGYHVVTYELVFILRFWTWKIKSKATDANKTRVCLLKSTEQKASTLRLNMFCSEPLVRVVIVPGPDNVAKWWFL